MNFQSRQYHWDPEGLHRKSTLKTSVLSLFDSGCQEFAQRLPQVLLVGHEWRLCQGNRCLYSSCALDKISRREAPKVLGEGAELVTTLSWVNFRQARINIVNHDCAAFFGIYTQLRDFQRRLSSKTDKPTLNQRRFMQTSMDVSDIGGTMGLAATMS